MRKNPQIKLVLFTKNLESLLKHCLLYKCMKNIFKLFLLSPVVFSTIGCQNKPEEPKELKPIDVVVISGQSNAVGCTFTKCIKRSIGSSKETEYMRGYEGIKIAYDCWTKDVKADNSFYFFSQNKSKDDGFVKVMLGQGNSLSTFGPEIGIAESMHEKYAGKLFLIKYACGASNLKDDWTKRNSPMYGRFIEYVKNQMGNLKKQGYEPTIKAFCWMQGEGDSYDGYYQEYYDNLKEFVGNVRTDLKELAGNKEIPFIDAGINNSPQWQYYRKVNEAKERFANDSENNIYIDTIEAGLHTNQEPFDEVDTAHYDTESQVLLGKLFAEKFEQFLDK